MKILITGAKGQLAQEIVKIAEKRKHSIYAKSREELDITDFRKVSEAVSRLRPDLVINCAAYNDVDRAESEWREAFLVNGIGVKNLAIACENNKATIVHFSTDYVFNGEKRIPYTIADLPAPLNRYGESKLLGEQLLMAYTTRFYIIRVSWVFGSGRHSFPLKLMKWGEKEKKLRIVENQVSSPSYTEDIARAVMALVETDSFGLYHITNSGYCSRYRWAEFILKRVKWDGELEKASLNDFNTPAKRPEYSVLDNFPLKETIGYELPGWEDATERFLKKIMEVI